MGNNDNISFDLRDGTGQKQRHPAPLDPAWFQVDERGTADLLRYAQALADRIRYFNPDDTPGGGWGAFLPTDANGPVSVEDIMTYLRDPAIFANDPGRSAWLSRPHFVLFLTFLELLGLLRGEMNLLSKRHLDFYYREILGFASRPAQPDELHLLLQLAKGVNEYPLPAGALVQAGKDAKGRLRTYRTNREIVVNRAQVADVRNVFVERQFQPLETCFQEARVGPDPFVSVLRLVYGTNGTLEKLNDQDINTDENLVDALKPLLHFSEETLFLALSEFRRMMILNDLRNQDDASWGLIYEFLIQAGKIKWKKPNWVLKSDDDIKNFSARFNLALGFFPFPTASQENRFLKNMQGVYDLFDLYEQLEEMLDKWKNGDSAFDSAKLKEFSDFLKDQLFMPVVDNTKQEFLTDFRSMMKILDVIRRDWAGINRWLMKAGSKKRPGETYNPHWPELPSFAPGLLFPDLETRLTEALHTPPFPVNTYSPSEYWKLLQSVEQYFFLPFEEVKFIVDTVADYHDSKSIADLPRVFTLLEKAYREKSLLAGLNTLKNKRESDANGFITMLKYALGEPENSDWPKINNQTETPKILEELRIIDPITVKYLAENLFLRRTDFDSLLKLYDRFRDPDKKDPPAPKEWERLYRLLEAARRVKRNIPDAKPGKEIFYGIFARADATAVETIGNNWRTFGDTSAGSVAEVGLAFCSPMLQLAGGDRTVTLNIIAEPFSLPSGKSFFEYFDFSYWFTSPNSPGGWVNAGALTVSDKNTDNKFENITISLSLPTEVPAVTAPSPGLVPGDPDYPVLKMVLNQNQIGSEHTYLLLKNIVLKKVSLTVRVVGLPPLLTQNDTGSVDSSKSFEPFGPAPRVGSALLFAHPEICFKPLTKIGFYFQWKGIIQDLKKQDLKKHYDNYTSDKPAETTANAELSLVSRGTVVTKREIGLFEEYPLAETGDYPHAWSWTVEDKDRNEQKKYKYYDFKQSILPESAEMISSDIIMDWDRYWRLELNTDFLHGVFPAIAAEKAMEFSLKLKNDQISTDKPTPAGKYSLEGFKLNPPYTPQLKDFKLYYEASATLLDVTKNIYSGRHTIRHLHPFGNSQLRKESRAANPAKQQYYLLPDYPFEGELYIGLRDCMQMQQVSLLFQMAEGSANPDLEKTPISWSYLTPDGWQPFDKGEILLDETDGLTNSGILQVILPANATRLNPLLPLGLHWLRASIATNRTSVCDTIGIYTQAVTATRVLDPDSPDDPGQSLPPGTVQGFYERQSGIKKVEQPFASSGGRSEETDRDFYTRVSERLRHRQRPLAQWDVERLVLEEFPDVYKAKCLTATDAATGEVKVIVVPDIRGKVLFDAYEPKVPLNRLAEISAYLDARGAPLARFRAINPVYITLEVQAYVQFRPGYDPRYYLGRLDEELRQFLAPWAFDSGADIAINHTIYPSVVVNFIEERPYIDFAAGVRLFETDPEGNTATVDAAGGGAQTTARPDAIWVSARKHFIELAETRPDLVSISYDGIEFMRVEYDFIVDG